MSQIELSEVLKVKPQRVNKIVRGKENLTLETIYKLSEALNFQLITFPKYGWSFSENSNINYINLSTHQISNASKELESEITISNIELLITISKQNEYKGWNTNSPYIVEAETINE